MLLPMENESYLIRLHLLKDAILYRVILY